MDSRSKTHTIAENVLAIHESLDDIRGMLLALLRYSQPCECPQYGFSRSRRHLCVRHNRKAWARWQAENIALKGNKA